MFKKKTIGGSLDQNIFFTFKLRSQLGAADFNKLSIFSTFIELIPKAKKDMWPHFSITRRRRGTIYPLRRVLSHIENGRYT